MMGIITSRRVSAKQLYFVYLQFTGAEDLI